MNVCEEAGYAAIEWACAPSYDKPRVSWQCHEIMHDGDGPLGKPFTVRSPVGTRSITASDAAEQAAAIIYRSEDGLNEGDRITIKVAIALNPTMFCAFGVRVKLEASFEAAELWPTQ